MADYAPNYTGRYRVRYSALGQEHVNVFRTGRTAPSMGTLATSVAAFYNALTVLRVPSWVVLGADFAAADSEIFLPVVPPAVEPGEGAAVAQAFKPVFLSFVGRSTGGSRATLFVYGLAVDPIQAEAQVQDWRYQSSESADIAAAITALGDVSGQTAIDDNEIVWKPYANIGANAYYQRKARG